ncbi:MAG: hypothetical protein ACRCW1_00525 [Anaerotignaceae bacterium]
MKKSILTSYGNIKKVPRGLKICDALGYKNILNFGCGLGYEYHMQQLKHINFINYDPYIPTIDTIPDININIDIVVCNNVINVIESDIEVNTLLNQLERYNKPIIITVYEGDKTGVGRVTAKGTYQRNLKSKDYQILHNRGYVYKKNMWYKNIKGGI